MKIISYTLLLFFASTMLFAQEANKEKNYLEINPNGQSLSGFSMLEHWPMYPNGIEGINQHIADNLKYPIEAKRKKIEGRVVVSYIVQQDSTVGEIKVIESANPLLDEEAIRVISIMDKWKPAIKNEKPVKIAYQQIINFKL